MKPSGIEWIGDIPDDWEVKRVKNTGKLIGGSAFPDEYQGVKNEEIPFIKVKSLAEDPISRNGKDSISESIRSKLNAEKFIIGSVVFAKVGAALLLQRFRILEFESCIDNNMMGFIPLVIEPRFFKYVTVLFDFSYFVNPGTVPSINQEQIGNIKIPFPPLKTQQKIADYLGEKCGEIDATIAKQKESIEKLKAYKQSLISETVTKGLDKSAPLKPSGIEWIGDIPDDWEVRKLLSIFKEHKDRNKNLEEQNLLSLSYGKIKRKDINNNDGLLPASFETYNIVENGDIVFRLTDLQNDKRSLRTGIVTQRGIITSAYVTIRPKIRLDSRFFHYLYHMYDICKVFYGMGDGVRQGMGFEDLKNIPTLIPPLKTQQKIADYLDSKCSQIDKYITEKQNIIQKLDAYKKSLIFECVTGKHKI